MQNIKNIFMFTFYLIKNLFDIFEIIPHSLIFNS